MNENKYSKHCVASSFLCYESVCGESKPWPEKLITASDHGGRPKKRIYRIWNLRREREGCELPLALLAAMLVGSTNMIDSGGSFFPDEVLLLLVKGSAAANRFFHERNYESQGGKERRAGKPFGKGSCWSCTK